MVAQLPAAVCRCLPLSADVPWSTASTSLSCITGTEHSCVPVRWPSSGCVWSRGRRPLGSSGPDEDTFCMSSTWKVLLSSKKEMLQTGKPCRACRRPIASSFSSHGDAIRSLTLPCQVVEPMSLQQMRMEGMAAEEQRPGASTALGWRGRVSTHQTHQTTRTRTRTRISRPPLRDQGRV